MFKKTWIELESTHLTHNLNQLYHITQKPICFIVKANAYGHGMAEIAHSAHDHPAVSSFGVATLSEAGSLRESGITKPILVLSIFDEPLEAVIETKAIPFVDEISRLKELNALGKKYNQIIPVHVKIDTGLHRFGFYLDQLPELLTTIQQLSFVKVDGICTHFAQVTDQEYTAYQKALFEQALQIILPHYPHAAIHASNSDASFIPVINNQSFIRVGLAALGLWNSESKKQEALALSATLNLKPVLHWKSEIIRIKEIPANQTVGYNRSSMTTRPTTIGIVPVGYAHGLSIHLSNKGHFLIGQKLAPIIGKVAMNVTSIDITDIPLSTREVTIMSDHETVHPHTIAQHANLPNVRTVLTALNPHIPRIVK